MTQRDGNAALEPGMLDSLAPVGGGPPPAAPRTLAPRPVAMVPLLFLLVLAWHAALLTLLKPSVRPAHPRPYALARPSIIAMTRSELGQISQEEARALWAPVLLSLPSSFGFSAPLGAGAPRTAPAFDLPREELQFLSRAALARPSAAEAGAFSPGLDALASARLSRPLDPPRLLPPVSALSPPSPQSVHLLFLHGAAPQEVETRPWPDAVSNRQARAWEAVIQAWADDEGALNEVLLETRTEDRELNAALAQAVRTWSLQPGASTNWLRLRVRSFGAPHSPVNGDTP